MDDVVKNICKLAPMCEAQGIISKESLAYMLGWCEKNASQNSSACSIYLLEIQTENFNCVHSRPRDSNVGSAC